MNDSNHMILNEIDLETWQRQAIEVALIEAKRKDTIFFENDEIMQWLETWGSEGEKDFP